MLSFSEGWVLGMAPTNATEPAKPPVETPAGAATQPATGPAGNTTTMTASGSASQKAPPGLLEQLGMFPLIILMFVVLYFVMIRGGRKEEKNRKKQIAAMKKGDEVLLISGKFGKVVDIKDDRVVVKVDEANNVKETYLKSAIQKVVVDEEKK